MQAAAPDGAPGHRGIDVLEDARGTGELRRARIERRFPFALQGVSGPADRFPRLGVERGQRPDDVGQRAVLASQGLGTQILEPALIRLWDLAKTLPQAVEACEEVAHAQRAFFATSASCSNAPGSRTARSARTLRLISTPALRRPFINRLYDRSCSRAAALMRVIQRRRNSPFLRRRSR